MSILRNSVVQGDCIDVMRKMESASVDFILTDPPYLVNYCDRAGRTIANDVDARWVKPAFAEMHRVLKDDTYCLSFYGWNKADVFFNAWRAAGFRIVGHVVFRKKYASSVKYFQCQHEQAYLLAKGNAPLPAARLPDVVDWVYTGNRLHPTQKPITVLRPFIDAFCKPGGVVLDPFCGSGSTLVAANMSNRDCIGIELELRHRNTASLRLACSQGLA